MKTKYLTVVEFLLDVQMVPPHINNNPHRRHTTTNNNNHLHHDDDDNNNHQPPHPISFVQRVIFWVRVFLLLVLVCLCLIELKFKHGNMKIQVVDIDEFHVNFDFINEEAIKLNGNATLDILFKVSGNFERDMGHFKITTTMSRQWPIVAFSNTSYSLLSEYGREILRVKFESSYPTHFPPNKFPLFTFHILQITVHILFADV